MIGQKNVYNRMMETDAKSVILFGESGSGKTALAREYAESIGAVFIDVECPDVETIGDIVQDTRYSTYTRVYCFENVEVMPALSQNIVLKTIEDVKTKDKFVFCTNDMQNVLPTIQSRSAVFKMGTYTYGELVKYSETRCGGIDVSYCRTPGDVEYKKFLMDTGIYEDIIELVFSINKNIDGVKAGNVFKIIDRLKSVGADRTMYIWIVNALIELYRYNYELNKICQEFKRHLIHNNTSPDRTFEQLMVMLNGM